MRTRVDAQLRLEAARYALRFACDDCAHFDEGGDRCSLEYPATPRRGALQGEGDAEIELCKSFELG